MAVDGNEEEWSENILHDVLEPGRSESVADTAEPTDRQILSFVGEARESHSPEKLQPFFSKFD